MQIDLPIPRKLVRAEHYRLLGQIAKPSTSLREQRAALALALDDFATAKADITAIAPDSRSPGASLLLARACLKMGEAQEGENCLALLDTAVLKPRLRCAVMIEQAAVLRALARPEEATILLESVLAEDPANSAALRKLAAILFDLGKPDEALRICEALRNRGIVTTRLLGTQATALAALGRRGEAEAVRGSSAFFSSEQLEDVDALNSEVIEELRSHPALRFGNSAQASRDSWRVDELRLREQPAITRLLQEIAHHAAGFAASLKPSDHPWFTSRPDRVRMNAWAIIAPAGGCETWHTHDGGWLSGVYYLAVPGGMSKGPDDPAGAIEFGWTERLLDAATHASLPSHLVHPEPGMLLMFPSHIHHRTFPHMCSEDRICIAFDMVPEG
ncbi:putative 2OG-Fe(II) oxygenase [Aurantiacibacter marinus]|nr:putative 2OG-Fe(II) oxygenase [Aurantiacibacter marinus]